MEEFNLREIDWYGFNETIIHPLALIFTIIQIILTYVFPKKYASIPLILVALFITDYQRIVILGMDFNMIRLIILFGFIRVIVKKDYLNFSFNPIDRLIIFFTFVSVIAYSILWMTSSAFVNRLGFAFDSIGAYFLFRFFITDLDSVKRLIFVQAIAIIPIAISMSIEQMYQFNLFSIFGGLRETVMTRDGLLRAQAAFSHPILAGTYGAFAFALIWTEIKQNIGFKKFLLIIGLVSSCVVIFTANSSGAILSLMAAVAGLFLWKLRNHLKFIKVSTIIMLVVLHFIMKDPVWAILYRLKIISSSTGYHRFRLIDNAINRFSEWALVGVKSTAHWGWGLQDVTNMYLRVGINGGFLSLLLFVIIIFICFNAVGNFLRNPDSDIFYDKFVWGLGVALFVHTVSFVGVAYFGQIIIFLFLSFAILSLVYDLNKTEYQ